MFAKMFVFILLFVSVLMFGWKKCFLCVCKCFWEYLKCFWGDVLI